MKLIPSATLPILLATFLSLTAAGCLTVERKEITFWVKPDGSGNGRLVFRGIGSVQENGTDNTLTDYTHLVNTYFKGKELEERYPAYSDFKKRIYEENGKLVGEVTFRFSHYEDVGLYRYQDRGPWMYHIGYRSEFVVEQFDTSNGTAATELMPVLFWPENTTEFRISSHFDGSDLSVRPLLPLYKRIGTD